MPLEHQYGGLSSHYWRSKADEARYVAELVREQRALELLLTIATHFDEIAERARTAEYRNPNVRSAEVIPLK